MEVYKEEVFGPVLVCLEAASLGEALALVNANPHGNGAAVFTRSGAAARRFQAEVQCGMVGINVPIPVSGGGRAAAGRSARGRRGGEGSCN
jgi:malonate-semialdehyde dehydrogenase (acetylating)/methylmalonate-semialdehyde dehydrogenase